MSRDYLTLGSTPYDESCAQVGCNNYVEQSHKECQVFIKQLTRTFENIPDGAYFSTKSFPHEFGTYREVVVNYDEDDEEAVEFAFNVESNTPAHWDEEAKKELGIN